MERRGVNIRKVLLGTILPILRRLPPRMASNVVAGIGRAEDSLIKGVRHRVDHAVREGGHHFGRDWDVAQVGRELAGNQIRWRTRDRLLDGLTNARVAPLFSVTGLEHLKAAIGQGKGVLLLGNHFGSNMMPVHWLLRENYAVRLFTERPRNISRFLSRQFDTDGPTGQRKLFISRRSTPAESAGSIMRASRVLKEGMLLLIAGDVRWPGPHSTSARFLGRTYEFSNTWVKLAAMTTAPVLTTFCRIDEDGAYRLEFQEPYNIPRGDLDAEATAGWVQRNLDAIEAQVGRYPANSNEYFFWNEDAATGPAARVG